jgi:hypothetical protein
MHATEPVAQGACVEQSYSVFSVSETDAATIRAALEREGELSAAVELRRLFRGVDDMAKARHWARVIAGWKPRPTSLQPSLRPPSYCASDGG